jgi:hypothetical protein
MIPGYDANVAAAAATLAWLREHFEVDPVIDDAISDLIETRRRQSESTGRETGWTCS